MGSQANLLSAQRFRRRGIQVPEDAMILELSADISANRSNPLTFLVLFVHRFGSWVYYSCKIPVLKQLCWFLYRILDLIFVRAMCGAELDGACRIGPGLRLPHGANGIVIHKESVIGSNVTIYHQVTLGGRNSADSHPPVIGNHVEIFAGAKLLGSIHIGEGATIGANAVVLESVPAHCLAVGVPARIIVRNTAAGAADE